MFWGSQKKAVAFKSLLKKETPALSYLFYHSEGDKEEEARTLEDITTAWSAVQLVMYSSTITIGLN